MPGTAILGLHWGDEGKGKIVDYYAKDSAIVVRCQGGNNAGHTVVVGDKTYKLHFIPSGVFYNKRVLLGNGMVIDPGELLKEIQTLREQGIEPNIGISERASIIMPYHRALDGIEDTGRGSRSIGTTKRGIGPTYSDKAAREGLKFVDLKNAERLRGKLDREVPLKQKIVSNVYGSEENFDKEKIFDDLAGYAKQLGGYICDVASEVNSALDNGEQVLFEGAQGTQLDIDHGTYPFCTSSNTTAGGICTGAGVGPRSINRVIGVVKAYTTRVGNGPMVTELEDDAGKYLREKGGEYGTTTGRPRRCGWLDGVITRYACMINGVDAIAITKLDVLDGLDKIKVCTAYELDGRRLEVPPADSADFGKCKPVYEEHDGWGNPDWKAVVGGAAMPPQAELYLKRIAEMCRTPVVLVGVGPARDATIECDIR
jgi:adenylosuccinate synthase